MKIVERTNDQGFTYTSLVPESQEDHPWFKDQADKDTLIQAVQDHYANGKLIRGSQSDGEGGHCVMGIIHMLNLGYVVIEKTKNWPANTSRLLVYTNNDGPGSYSPVDGDQTVTPKSYSELMMILKDSPVGEEK